MTSGKLDSKTIGWIGMGRMGYPMAERLALAGCEYRRVEPNAVKGRATHCARRHTGRY